MRFKNTDSQVSSFTGRLQLSDWSGLGQLARDEALGWLPPLRCARLQSKSAVFWHSEVCELRTREKPLNHLWGAQVLSKLPPASPPVPAHFSSQPQSHHSDSSFVLSPYAGLQTSPCPIPYSHSAMDLLGDLLDVWIRAWETSCLTLSKTLHLFVSVCKL